MRRLLRRRVYDLAERGKIFALGQEQSLIVSSKRDGSMAFLYGLQDTRKLGAGQRYQILAIRQVLTWFKEAFAGWDSILEELFANDKTYFIPRPQYCMPLDQTWRPRPISPCWAMRRTLCLLMQVKALIWPCWMLLELSECLTAKTLQ